MSNQHLNAAVQCQKFRGNTRLLLILLANRASDGTSRSGKKNLPFGWTARSLPQLMREMNTKRKQTVTSAMTELIDAGAIKRVRRFDASSKTFVDIDWLNGNAYVSGADSEPTAGTKSAPDEEETYGAESAPTAQQKVHPLLGAERVAKNNGKRNARTTEPNNLEPQTMSVEPNQDQNQVSELVSEGASFASLTQPSASDGAVETKAENDHDQRPRSSGLEERRNRAFAEAMLEPKAKPAQLANWSQRLGRLIDSEEWFVAEELYRDLVPMAATYPEQEILSLVEVAYDMQQRYTRGTQNYGQLRGAGYNDADNPVRSFWHWNQTHKKPQLVFFTMVDMAKAWWSDNPRGARPQWERHDPDSCPTCAKSPRSPSEHGL